MTRKKQLLPKYISMPTTFSADVSTIMDTILIHVFQQLPIFKPLSYTSSDRIVELEKFYRTSPQPHMKCIWHHTKLKHYHLLGYPPIAMIRL